ncbi:MAG TPA: hypothetical protein VGJ63_12890 [Micromonosporaceae bacterium]
MTRGGSGILLATVVALLAGASCDTSGPPNRRASAAPMPVAWHEVSLPPPAGAAGRLAPRDAITCGGRWYVVGAVVSADGATHPAAWSSSDARRWRTLRLTPRTPYGEVAILYAAGCRVGQLAAIGAQSGGAHGNPRVTQWYLLADGILDEVPAGLDLYGGSEAVNVGRIVGGPAGWLIVGNRVFGGAAWTSTDATAFRPVGRVPGLASDGGLTTLAVDAAAYRGGWVVVGSGRRAGRAGSDPLAWTSTDGRRWRRVPVGDATGDRYRVLQRVTMNGDALLAAGVDGDRFAAWTMNGGAWRLAGRFGALREGGSVQQVQGVAATGGRLWAAATDGRAYGLWASPDGGRTWRPTQTPIPIAAGGADRVVTVTGAGTDLLLVADDGRHGRAWVTNRAAG